MQCVKIKYWTFFREISWHLVKIRHSLKCDICSPRKHHALFTPSFFPENKREERNNSVLSASNFCRKVENMHFQWKFLWSFSFFDFYDKTETFHFVFVLSFQRYFNHWKFIWSKGYKNSHDELDKFQIVSGNQFICL